ncbi:hypothetical protein Kpho02_02340 [Kitasatospora phosalacinea]|uniref:Uncharacterized protein n=1 Tax=Kitasatospora phosalacinea TaxID=2065 RepID=A0A9W6Q0X3_9ACTN|nr:hypothetical protein Kpho02_02340 [Kitasatospora phosalacinea]
MNPFRRPAPLTGTTPDGAPGHRAARNSPEEKDMMVVVAVGAGAVLLCTCVLVLKRKRGSRG